MDWELAERMVGFMREHGLQEVEWRDDDTSLRLRLPGPTAVERVAASSAPLPVATPEATTTPVAVEPAPAGSEVTSPFVGTFYSASSPEAEPFVTVGKAVKKGDTLCIVEAMKLMNEIEAERDGTITAILVENEQPIEYGQALFRME